MVEKTLHVPGISCEHCVNAINKELGAVDGVEVVNVDIPTKTVTFRQAETVADAVIIEALADAGFDEVNA